MQFRSRKDGTHFPLGGIKGITQKGFEKLAFQEAIRKNPILQKFNKNAEAIEARNLAIIQEKKEIVQNMKALRERAEARGHWTPATLNAYQTLANQLQKLDER